MLTPVEGRKFVLYIDGIKSFTIVSQCLKKRGMFLLNVDYYEFSFLSFSEVKIMTAASENTKKSISRSFRFVFTPKDLFLSPFSFGKSRKEEVRIERSRVTFLKL